MDNGTQDTRYPVLGWLTLGYTAVKNTPSGPVTYPARASTFVFSSQSRERIEAVARALGGKPQPGQRTGGWFVVTNARELRVLLPSLDDQSVRFEYQMRDQAGALVRRCDGATCTVPADPRSGRPAQTVPCVCQAEGERRCHRTTRLFLVLPDLAEVPGIGVWVFSSRSESTYREVSSLLGMLKTVASHFRVDPVRIPLVMSVREIQRRDQSGSLRKWPVVSLQTTLSMAQLAALSRTPQDHSLPPGPLAPIAAGR